MIAQKSPPGRAETRDEKVIRAAKTTPSIKEIVAATGVPRRTVQKIVRAAREAGTLPASKGEDGKLYAPSRPATNGTPKGTTPRPDSPGPDAATPNPTRERLGVGVIRANEAINILKRIPKDDALRERGFQIVRQWMRVNK